MTISITNEDKNDLTITNDPHPEAAVLTIDDMTLAIDDAEGTIDDPRSFLTTEDKNNLDITNDSKN